MARPRKIAVLGGGIGSLSALFELTDLPGWQDRFEITVYQMGWQLGGKGASGRDPKRFHRNEEHGLHVWLGFYDNAFDLVDRCYRALDPACGHGFAQWTDAFRPIDGFVLCDAEFGRLDYPLRPKGGTPGRRKRRRHVIWGHAVRLAGMLVGGFERSGLIDIFRDGRAPGGATGRGRRGKPRIEVVMPRIGERFAQLPDDPLRIGNADREELLDDLRFAVKEFGSFSRQDFSANRRFLAYWELLVIGLGLLTGLVADRVVTEGYDVIEHLDWRQWLRGHGVVEDALASAPVRAAYDLVFGYERGNPARASVGAGTGTHCLLRMLLDYPGSVAYELAAGMGEAVFTPLYLVLRDRGVRFRFFHRVDRLGLGDDRRSVARIDFTRQARTRSAAPYAPLIKVKSLLCWPTAPLFDQLEDGEGLEKLLDGPAADGIGERGSLARGRDFDDVLLNIPLPALGAVAEDLAEESTAWRDMLNGVASTATLAAQLWMIPKTNDLGFPAESTLLGASEKPFDTAWDGDRVLRHEDFPPEDSPKACMYLCGSFPDSALSRGQEPAEAAREMARAWLDEHGTGLWNGVSRGSGFDWSCLYDPGKAEGPARLQWQHVAANVEPWARYVQSAPGTAQLRIRADKSGFDNLFLAGDWTRTALNAGCMEAAVMSGLRAARAISGEDIEISGEDELTGQPETPLAAIARRMTRIDDGVGSVDAVGVILPIAADDARRMLPRGLELMEVQGMAKGTHPLGVLYCRHWDVRPALAPAMLGTRYEELAFALPFVRPADGGTDGKAAAQPATVLPLLLVDNPLAAGGGFLLGFNKKIARMTVRGDHRLASSAFRGIPLLEFATRAAGAAGPAGQFPKLELALRIFAQPVLVRHPAGWRRVGMDFDLPGATVVPLSGRLVVHRGFLDGLAPASHELASIETSAFGAFGFASRWHLDGRFLPTR